MANVTARTRAITKAEADEQAIRFKDADLFVRSQRSGQSEALTILCLLGARMTGVPRGDRRRLIGDWG